MTVKDGKATVVEGIDPTPTTVEIDATAAELVTEREAVAELLG